MAATVSLVVITMVQELAPVGLIGPVGAQLFDHPPNCAPLDGVAVSVTVAPVVNGCEQVDPWTVVQLITRGPPGLFGEGAVTNPLLAPVPINVTPKVDSCEGPVDNDPSENEAAPVTTVP